MCPGMSSGADTLVIFGITGDLAKKMTFRALYRLEERGELDCRIIGVARDAGARRSSRTTAATRSSRRSRDPDEAVIKRLEERLDYHFGEFDAASTYEALKQELEGSKERLFYLEIPPSLFLPVVERLHQAGLTEGSRVMIEKPFGHDLESARQLNRRPEDRGASGPGGRAVRRQQTAPASADRTSAAAWRVWCAHLHHRGR